MSEVGEGLAAEEDRRREEGYSQAKESSLSVELDELQHDMMTELRIYTVMVNGSSLTPADNHHRERGAPSTHLRHMVVKEISFDK